MTNVTRTTMYWGMFTREGNAAVQAIAERLIGTTDVNEQGMLSIIDLELQILARESDGTTDEARDTVVREAVAGYVLDGRVPMYKA